MSQIKIPFHLCDPAQILFFGNFHHIYHQYLEDHIEDFDVSWKDWFQGEVGTPIRGLKTSYNLPLHFGKTYEAQLSLRDIGSSTVTFKFEVLDANSTVCAVTEVTHCFVGKATRKKTSVPKHIKEAFSKHLKV